MAGISCGQSKNDLFDCIQAFVKWLTWETKFVDGCPGEQWYRLFLKHFPDLKLHQAQLLSCQRVSISRNALNLWYRELFEYLEETSASSTNLFGYLMQMKQGSPWLHGQQKSSLVRGAQCVPEG